MSTEDDSGRVQSAFSELTPHCVMDLVEEVMPIRCTGMCRALTSYINRVYDLEMEDGSWVVVKFYRPGRWSQNALLDEQEFVAELAAAEVPVVAPIPGINGKLLHEKNGMHYVVYPKKAGRPLDEPLDDQWKELGRTLGRLHEVGARKMPGDRIRIHPSYSMQDHLETILSSEHTGMTPALRNRYEDMVDDLADEIEPLFDDAGVLRIHGDCHSLNILSRPGEPFHIIDFDDMAIGPAAQDIWMLLPGHVGDSCRELDLLLDGYETFREFDWMELSLIEPLRAMRFIHYTAWCAKQAGDGGFARLSPDWGTEQFWRRELNDLERQRQEIRDALSAASCNVSGNQ